MVRKDESSNGRAGMSHGAGCRPVRNAIAKDGRQRADYGADSFNAGSYTANNCSRPVWHQNVDASSAMHGPASRVHHQLRER